MTTAIAVASAYLNSSSRITISKGAISETFGRFPAMKITDPYSPTARAKASAKPVSKRREDRRQDHAGEGLPAARAERGRRFLELGIKVEQHRLHRAHHERQADEDQGHQNAERGERNLHAGEREQPAEPAILGEQGRERNARDRRRQRKRNIDDRIEQPPPRKLVAHQRPGHDRAEDKIDRRRRERKAEAQFQRIQGAAARHDRPELRETQRRRLEKKPAERNENDQREPRQGQPERDPESGNDARMTFEGSANHRCRPVTPHAGVDAIEDCGHWL